MFLLSITTASGCEEQECIYLIFKAVNNKTEFLKHKQVKKKKNYFALAAAILSIFLCWLMDITEIVSESVIP